MNVKFPYFDSLYSIDSALNSRFKNFNLKNGLKVMPNPNNLLNNMNAACMIIDSMNNKEKILIVGDYDTDGVCASCIMIDFFNLLNYKNIVFAMPNRFIHGYGFSKKLLEEELLNNPDISLVITVDNGVSSFDAGNICKEKNIKFIITDHHILEQKDGKENIPYCDFLINPHQEKCNFEYKDICGSMVAWYLCSAIKINILNNYNNFDFSDINKLAINYENLLEYFNEGLKKLLGLVGIATISDVMELNDLNHAVCKYAMSCFYHSKRFAFKIITQKLNVKSVDSSFFGFKLAPLLNSAGRLKDGKLALNFLRAESYEEAHIAFEKLQKLNYERQLLQEEVLNSALCMINKIYQNPYMIIAYGDDWHEGVLGIVASRLSDDYKKPAFVLCKNNNNIYKGSGRSYGNIDLILSLVKIKKLFKRYGGHMGAVGLEINEENLDEFIKSFKPVFYQKTMKIDVLGYINCELLSCELIEILNKYEPYGNGNPLPTFLFEMKLKSVKTTKKGHLSFIFSHNNNFYKAFDFSKKFNNYAFEINSILKFSSSISLDNFCINKEQIVLIIKEIFV